MAKFTLVHIESVFVTIIIIHVTTASELTPNLTNIKCRKANSFCNVNKYLIKSKNAKFPDDIRQIWHFPTTHDNISRLFHFPCQP